MNKYADASPCGNMVLAFFLIVFFAVLTGLVPPAMGTFLIPLGFASSIGLTISGIIQLKNGDPLGGNLNIAFSVFTWVACVETLLKVLKLMPADSSGALAWLTLAMALVVLGVTPFLLKANLAAGMFIIGADIFFALTSYASFVGSPTVAYIAAWGLPLCVFSCLWQGISVPLNSINGRTVFGHGPALIRSKPTIKGSTNS